MNAGRWTAWISLGLTALFVVSALGVAGGGASPLVGHAAVVAAHPAAARSAVSPSASSPASARGLSIAAPPTPLDAKPSGNAQATEVRDVLGSLNARGVPDRYIYLPDFAGEVHSAPKDGHVSPTYTTAPAPYGIGDFGLRNDSGTIVPFETLTTSLNATFSTQMLTGYSADISGPDEYGVQLNAVMNNVTLFGQSSYQFWTQNVFFYTPSNQTIQFVDNIWNFTGEELECNAFYSAGGTCVAPEYYYGLSAPIPAVAPYSVRLWLNSSVNDGRNEVTFSYAVGSADGDFAGTYDYAIFNSLTPTSTPVAHPAPYIANGYAYDPIGLPDDFELTLGGPGGGSNFDLFRAEGTYMTLSYLNESSGLYQNVTAAYNAGGDTGETSYGVNAAWADYPGCSLCVELNNGPSYSYGLWNVSGAPQLTTSWSVAPYYTIDPKPMTAFVFAAPGTDVTNLSDFQWVPDNLDGATAVYLPVHDYTLLFLAANYDPLSPYNIAMASTCFGTCGIAPVLAPDSTTGVYTPLWAFNETALAVLANDVTDGYGNYLLPDNQYAPVGQVPCGSDFGCANYPFFGMFNDWMFPVFPGAFLYDVAFATFSPPPSFDVEFPSGPSFQFEVALFGTPDSNDLQMMFYDDSGITVEGGTIGGWWLAQSYFGPSQSIGSITFWNTTYSEVYGNTFDVGGMGMFAYGGWENEIFNNSFYTFVPPSTYDGATTAAYFGSTGLVDADWGYADLYAGPGDDICYTEDICDVVWNNIFDTWVTATQLYYDPYTGDVPLGTFSQAYNIPYLAPATNIIGGDFLGGNYWWDYGYAYNPYNVLPYAGINYIPTYFFGAPPASICVWTVSLCDMGGGDWYPLTLTPLYTANFTETGLPAGTVWGVESPVGDDLGGAAYFFEAGDVSNFTLAGSWLNLSDPDGFYEYLPISENPNYGAAPGYFFVDGASVEIVVDFAPAYSLTVTESGLPAGDAWSLTVYSESTGAEQTVSGTATSLAVGSLLPGAYEWEALTDVAGYGAWPVGSDATIVAANVSASVAFVPAVVLSIHAVGLAIDSIWTFGYSPTSGIGQNLWIVIFGTWLNLSLPEGNYTWSALSSGYEASPANGVVDLSGPETLTIDFAPAATIAFSERGLPSGTSWTVSVTQGDTTSLYTSTTSTINVTAAVGSFSFTASASGFAASPASGSGTLAAGVNPEAISFAPATGTLAGTVAPSGATLTVDGATEALGAGGSFSLTLPVGVHAVEVTDSGYVPYFNNVTIATGATTHLTVSLTASSSSGLAGISTTGWALIGLLAAVALVLLITTVVFARRGRRGPPPMTSYTPPAPPAATAPGATPTAPPWQEGPSPPPGTN